MSTLNLQDLSNEWLRQRRQQHASSTSSSTTTSVVSQWMTASSSDLLVVYVRPMRLLVCTVNAAALSSNAVASTSNAVAWRSVRLVPTSTNASLDDTGDNDDEEDGDGGDDGDASNESNDVRSIALNADASLLLLSGARGCHVVELNQRFYHELRRFNSSSSGSSSVNSTSMPLFDCRCFALGEYWHATHSSVRVVDARWHPLALDRCAVLTSDNALRIYDAGAPARAAECESMHRVLLPAAAQPLVAFAFGHDGVSKEAWREGWGMMAAYFLTADTRLFALCPVVPRSCVLPARLLAELAQLTHQHDDDTLSPIRASTRASGCGAAPRRVVASAVRARPDESALDWVRFDAADSEPLLLQGPLWSSSGADLRAVALECVSGGAPAALVVAQSNGVLNALVGIEPLQPRWRLTATSARIAAIAASTTLHTYERLDMALDVPLPMRASHAVVLQRIGGVDDALVALHCDGAHVVRLRWLGTLRRWCQEALIGGGEQRSLALPDAPASLVRGVLLGGALRGAATLLSLAGTDDVFVGLSSNTGLGAVPLQLDQRERTRRCTHCCASSSAGEPAAERRRERCDTRGAATIRAVWCAPAVAAAALCCAARADRLLGAVDAVVCRGAECCAAAAHRRHAAIWRATSRRDARSSRRWWSSRRPKWPRSRRRSGAPPRAPRRSTPSWSACAACTQRCSSAHKRCSPFSTPANRACPTPRSSGTASCATSSARSRASSARCGDSTSKRANSSARTPAANRSAPHATAATHQRTSGRRCRQAARRADAIDQRCTSATSRFAIQIFVRR
jgi:hypothetical protein